jgi:hypothetical protein
MRQQRLHVHQLAPVVDSHDEPVVSAQDVKDERAAHLIRGRKRFPDFVQAVPPRLARQSVEFLQTDMVSGCFFARFIRPLLLIAFTKSMFAYCLHQIEAMNGGRR